MAIEPGASIGRYVVRRKLAEGGMAEIYLATVRGPEGFEKEVVIKRIRSFLSDDPQFVQMFIAEARLASRLNHANIVQIFDFDQHEDSFYLAMEYVRGRSLWELRKRCRERMVPTPPTLVAQIGREVARGLDYAHRLTVRGSHLGLVHRDVTPHNVLLSWEGAVKLTDFGIAKAGNKLTSPGMLKGKFAYMSPEQARGDEVDARTDVFALGVVLWEMLTGGRLFEGDSDIAVLRAVQKSNIAPPGRLNPDVHPELDAVVMKALERDLDQRYQSAQELERALGQFILGHADSVDDTDLAAFLRTLYAEEQAAEENERKSISVSVPKGSLAGGTGLPKKEPTAVLSGTSRPGPAGVAPENPDEDANEPTWVVNRGKSAPPVRPTDRLPTAGGPPPFGPVGAPPRAGERSEAGTAVERRGRTASGEAVPASSADAGSARREPEAQRPADTESARREPGGEESADAASARPGPGGQEPESAALARSEPGERVPKDAASTWREPGGQAPAGAGSARPEPGGQAPAAGHEAEPAQAPARVARYLPAAGRVAAGAGAGAGRGLKLGAAVLGVGILALAAVMLTRGELGGDLSETAALAADGGPDPVAAPSPALEVRPVVQQGAKTQAVEGGLASRDAGAGGAPEGTKVAAEDGPKDAGVTVAARSTPGKERAEEATESRRVADRRSGTRRRGARKIQEKGATSGHADVRKAAEEAPGSGTLIITASPWANVFVDGESRGDVAGSKPFLLPAGKHVVKFKHPRRTLEKAVRVQTNKTAHVSFSLFGSD